MSPAELRDEVARTAAEWDAASERADAARAAYEAAWAAAEEADAYGYWTAAEIDEAEARYVAGGAL